MTAKGILPREGIYLDSIITGLRRTILHPLFTFPLLCLVQTGNLDIASPYRTSFQYLAAASALLWLNDYLSAKSRNNWTTNDTLNWEKELVVVTGGSSGIGAGVAQRLAAMGARVVVVDFAPLTYSPGMLNTHRVTTNR